MVVSLGVPLLSRQLFFKRKCLGQMVANRVTRLLIRACGFDESSPAIVQALMAIARGKPPLRLSYFRHPIGIIAPICVLAPTADVQ